MCISYIIQELEIKKLAKEGNKEGCIVLARQLVQLRKQKTRTFAANSKIKGIGFQNKAMQANVKLADVMGQAGKTMQDMNSIMKPEQIAANVNAFSRESMKMDMTEEMSKFIRISLKLKLKYWFQLMIRLMIFWMAPMMNKRVIKL